MARAVYPFALCLTLGLLATMWLRPGLAQELIEIASRIRGQSPDRGGAAAPAASTPAYPQDPFGQVPYDSVARPPMQPTPVSRPIEWAGTPVQSTANMQYPANVQPAAYGGSTQAPAGVVTWDPAAGQAAPSNIAAPPGNPAAVQHPAMQGGQVAAPGGAPLQANPNLGAENLQIWPSPPKDVPDAQIAARIGTDVPILVGDLKAIASYFMHQNNMHVPENQLEAAYQQSYRPILKSLIELKLIYSDALHTIPKEAFAGIESQINTGFNQEFLPKLLESYGVNSAQELDRKLRERNSSLDFMRRYFFEQTVANQWKLQKVKREEIPPSEVLGYYRTHHADYEYPAKARWEELMVRFDRYSDKAAANAAIAQMGNAVQAGKPFAEVARQSSHGLTAHEGGQWDWTTKGSLTTKIVDEAIFSLPVGSLSEIFESDRGFHIVRVTERHEAGRRSFVDVQPEIKKQIKEEKERKQIEEYLTEIRKRTPVWTMFDNEPGGLDGLQQERRSTFD